jgi:hypothetical protein
LTSSSVCAAFLCKEERCSRQGGGLDGPHRRASNITRTNPAKPHPAKARQAAGHCVSIDTSSFRWTSASRRSRSPPFVEALRFRTQSAIRRCISVLSFFVRTLCPAPEEAAQEQARK